MGVDIKLPIGLIFSIYGIILSVYGLMSRGNIEVYSKSLGINVNLWTGVFMLFFGAMMLALSKLNNKKK